MPSLAPRNSRYARAGRRPGITRSSPRSTLEATSGASEDGGGRGPDDKHQIGPMTRNWNDDPPCRESTFQLKLIEFAVMTVTMQWYQAPSQVLRSNEVGITSA